MEDYLSVKISYDSIEELTLVGLKDQYLGVLENYEEGTQAENLLDAYEAVLKYNMVASEYEEFVARINEPLHPVFCHPLCP